MNLAVHVDQKRLMEVLLNVGTVRPVFIWGAPGIGKSAIVEQFAEEVGLPCVSLLGSQLAPEDLMGVPRIVEGRSEFCPQKPRSPFPHREAGTCSDALHSCGSQLGERELAGISVEIAQMAVTPENGKTLPAWFLVETAREIALTRRKLG